MDPTKHRKLGMITDFTSGGTKIVDSETGELIEGVQSVTWEANAGQPAHRVASLTIKLHGAFVDFEFAAVENP